MPFPIDESTRDTIRHHFRKKQLVWEEAYFVNVLQSTSDKYDVYWSVIALRDCGTTACIPALKDKLQFPMQDVKCGAMLTIAHVAGSEETLLYADALSGTTFRDKGYAMWAIRVAADARAVDAVLAYFKKNRAKLKQGKLANDTLADGLEYLDKYRTSNSDIAAFFDEVDGVWPNLPEADRRDIAKRLPYFAGRPSGSDAPN